MADELPEITLGYADGGDAAVYVDLTPYASARDLIAAAPWICETDQALLCAQAVNHLAQERGFTVIEDPARFAEWYRSRRASEDPEKLNPDGGFGLRNYGIPALDSIAVPAIGSGELCFFAVNRQLGVPYRVTAPLTDLDAPDYDPVPMTVDD